jgi:hydroxymethylbilane synthase
VLQALEADCNVPLAAYAEVAGEELHLRALVASLDGRRVVRAEIRGEAEDSLGLGAAVAAELLAGGAEELLAELRRDAAS